jgi:hypothetical protein
MGTTSFAAEVTDLYQSHTAISSQNDAERQRATATILQQVLVKVVGNQSALAKKDLSGLLEQADQFVTHYAYERDPILANQQLLLTFNEKALNQVLSSMGLPIWHKSRPESVLWLVVNKGNSQKILGAEDESATAYQTVKQTAQQRGLPVFLPLMDLQDQHQLRFAQSALTMDEDSAFAQASKRYGADIIILASVVTHNDSVSIAWQWLKGGQLQRYQSEGQLAFALSAGMNMIADTLASEYAVVDTQASKRDYQMVIRDIKDFTDYSRVQSYLNGLQTVSQVDIVSLKDKQLDLKLRLTSGLTLFNQMIQSDGLLMEERAETQQPNSDIIYYRLRP